MRIVTVLKSGPEYRAEHAIWLAKQINRFNPEAEIVCLNDVDLRHPLIRSIPLQHPWQGWWSKLNIFSDVLEGDVFYIDLDTVVLGPIDDLVTAEKTTFLRDFYQHRLFASGVMLIKEHDKSAVWDEFVRQPAAHMAQNRTRKHWGDQGFYSRILTDFDLWQETKPGRIVSYKVHVKDKQPPPGVSLVCFHGTPRPWEAGRDWVPEL